MSKLFKISFFAIGFLPMLACSLGGDLTSGENKNDSVKWASEGSLVIARPLPKLSQTETRLWGFMPHKSDSNSKYQLVINKSSSSVTVFHGSNRLDTFHIDNIDQLTPGEYTVKHKQRHPVWYATDKYFQNRGLSLPAQNSKERYLKGALGDFVIYLDEKTPLHNSAVWAEDVGGIRVADNVIAKIYYQIEVGSLVQVE